MTITALVDLAKEWDGVHDQGSRPTCLAFALSELNRRAHDITPLSPEYLYRAAARLAGQWAPGKGLVLSHAEKALSETGQPSLESCPYRGDEPEELPPELPDTGEDELFCNTVARLPVEPATIAKGLAYGPVGIIVRVTQSFFKPVDGVIANATQTLPGTTHAVVVTGHGIDEIGAPYFRIRNSWGAAWGESGYAWLPVDYVVAHGVAAFYVPI